MKRLLTLTLCCLGAAALLVSCGGNAAKKAEQAAAQAAADSVAAAEQTQRTMDKIANLPAEPVFDIITSMGVIKIKLYADTPKHRENFAKLALEKYYDGILFHRVIDGFMIQAGDPLTKDANNKPRFGTGGPDYTIPAEFVPAHNHKKGALAAARRGDAVNPYKESSGSQFYLVQDERNCAQLDGEYTVFGEVVRGMTVVDKIAAQQKDGADRPVEDIKIISATIME